MEEVIKILTELGSAGVQEAIDAYARWYLASAICWFIGGLGIVICGIKIGKSKLDDKSFDEDACLFWNKILRYIICGFCILIGLLIAIYNLATICSPTGYAIHNFIIDIKP